MSSIVHLPRRRHPGFGALRKAAAAAPLTEIMPATPGEVAALGFALAWIALAAPEGPVVWAAPEWSFGEDGAPHAEGLAQFGLTLDRLLLVRARTQADALWAAEQALAVPGAMVLASIPPARKPLGLTATRRLLLAAKKHRARGVLLRLDGAGPSAAWTRWRVAAAPSDAAGRELGAPAFAVTLERNRAGPAGLSWHLHWHANEHAFHSLDTDVADLARPVAAASAD